MSKGLSCVLVGVLLAYSQNGLSAVHGDGRCQETLASIGSSSGGGGFVTANSKNLLEQTSFELGQILRLASPEIFSKIPKGWDQNKLANLVEEIRFEPDKMNRREGVDLMFDYGSESGAKYIAALKPFFHSYASVPVDFLSPSSLWSIRLDLYRQMLHEAVHHMGIGTRLGEDRFADSLAKNILASLVGDMMLCRPVSNGSEPVRRWSGWFVFRSMQIGYKHLDLAVFDAVNPWQTKIPYVYEDNTGSRIPQDIVGRWTVQESDDQLVLVETTTSETLRLNFTGSILSGTFELGRFAPMTKDRVAPMTKDRVAVTCERHYTAIDFP